MILLILGFIVGIAVGRRLSKRWPWPPNFKEIARDLKIDSFFSGKPSSISQEGQEGNQKQYEEKDIQDLKSPSSKIVFERFGDNIGIPLGIFTVNPDGSDCRQIFSSSSGPGAPEWSPDGRWIAFHDMTKDELLVNVFIMRPNGKEVRQVTNYKDCSAACPTWSPDSKKIAYCITKDAKNQVGVVDIEILQCKQITSEESNGYPVWTPWGDIVFFKNHNKIYIMDSYGRNQREYEIFQEGDQEPVWSRDGKQIVFTRHGRICVMDADGSNLRILPVELSNLVEVSWSPDSRQIAFSGELRGGEPRNIYIVDIDGNNLKCIVENRWIKAKGKEVSSNDLCWSPYLYATISEGKKEMAEEKEQEEIWTEAYGPHVFEHHVKMHRQYGPNEDNIIKVGEKALGCLRCHEVTELEPCSNCGDTGRQFGLSQDNVIGLFCSRCNKGFTTWKCHCGCENPITHETILEKKAAKSGKSGCFIATAAFGTPLAEEVLILSSFRDNYLSHKSWGRKIITFYYQVSPSLAFLITRKKPLCWLVRSVVINPIVKMIKRNPAPF